jgi:hypothetical protein
MTEILHNTPETEVASIDLSCGRFDALRARHFIQRFPPHFHDTFAIGVVESGSARLVTHRGEWIARAGSILAFSPGEVHGAEALGSNGYTYRMIYPTRALMRGIAALPRDGDERAPIFRTPVIEDREIAGQLRTAHIPLMAGDWRTSAESQLIDGLRVLARRHGALNEVLNLVNRAAAPYIQPEESATTNVENFDFGQFYWIWIDGDAPVTPFLAPPLRSPEGIVPGN